MTTSWKKNEPTAALRRCAINVESRVDGSRAPLATSSSALLANLKYRDGGFTFADAGGTLTNTGYDGRWVYEATQAETNVIANEIEIELDDPTWEAQTLVAIESDEKLDDIKSLIGDIAGLLHRNALVDNVSYTSGKLTAARVRVFADSTALGAATEGAPDGDDDEVARFLFTATLDGDSLMETFRGLKDL